MCIYSLTYPPEVGCKKPSLSAKCAAIYLCMCGICVNTHILTAHRACANILINKEVCKGVLRHFCTLFACIYLHL